MSLFTIPIINMPISYYDVIPFAVATLAVIASVILDRRRAHRSIG